MKVTISNFKSIRELKEFEFLPLNVLAGTNSGGKSSFVQVLLLLKQSFETDSAKGLCLDGRYVNIPTLSDFVYEKTKSGKFSISISLSSKDIGDAIELNQECHELGNVQSVMVSMAFHVNGATKYQSFSLDIEGEHDIAHFSLTYITKDKNKGKYNMAVTHPAIFLRQDTKKTKFNAVSPSFQGLFPLFVETSEASVPILKLGVVDIVKDLVTGSFSKIYYIGPSRISPLPVVSYTTTKFNDVNVDGQYTRFLLHTKQKDIIDYTGKTLLDEVKYWMCERMQLAKDIRVDKDGTNSYRVKLVDSNNMDVELYQMGFGLSQILPIIVQGLLIPRGGMLIVDAPEVHLHPAVQGHLLDFFINISGNGRRVLIETHSDHIVVRTRRRIAEIKISPKDVNLCYVTNEKNGSEYRSIIVDANGNMKSSLPEGFMDTLDEDYRAILLSKMPNQQ